MIHKLKRYISMLYYLINLKINRLLMNIQMKNITLFRKLKYNSRLKYNRLSKKDWDIAKKYDKIRDNKY